MDIYTKTKLLFLKYSFKKLATYLEVVEEPLRESVREHTNTQLSDPINYPETMGFLNQARQSFIVTLMSQVELWLIRDCRVEAERRDIRWGYSRRCSPFDNVKHFYRNKLGDPFEFGEHEEWEKTLKCYEVRNCIVHQHGSLTGFNDQPINSSLKDFIDREAGLSVQGLGKEIYIEPEFCRKTLMTAYKLLENMFSSIPEL